MKKEILFSASLLFSAAATAAPIFSYGPYGDSFEDFLPPAPTPKILPPTADVFIAQPKMVFQTTVPDDYGFKAINSGLAVYQNPHDHSLMILSCEEIARIRTKLLVNLVRAKLPADKQILQGKLDELDIGKISLSCTSKWSGLSAPGTLACLSVSLPVADRMQPGVAPY
jgi:hypothetical protein